MTFLNSKSPEASDVSLLSTDSYFLGSAPCPFLICTCMFFDACLSVVTCQGRLVAVDDLLQVICQWWVITSDFSFATTHLRIVIGQCHYRLFVIYDLSAINLSLIANGFVRMNLRERLKWNLIKSLTICYLYYRITM